MGAKRGVSMASVLSAALLGSGCNNSDDTVARGDTGNTRSLLRRHRRAWVTVRLSRWAIPL
jgi:hypothetical protein